jgi:hypothetical protein
MTQQRGSGANAAASARSIPDRTVGDNSRKPSHVNWAAAALLRGLAILRLASCQVLKRSEEADGQAVI